MRWIQVAVVASSCALVLPACSSASGGDPGLGTSGGGGGDDSGVLLPDGGTGGTGGSLLDGAPSEGAPPTTGEVYAHSDTVLYKLEPISKTVTVVGTFDCLDSGGDSADMWDIALDKNGNMFGSANAFTSARLVSIDRATAHCSVITTATSLPNSLTFVPEGTLSPNEEILVGFDLDSYVRIDKTTGAVQPIGSLNPNPTGTYWESSGDIVSIIGDKTYLTVKEYGAGLTSDPDTIVEVNPVTGQALKVIGQTGFARLWGLGYWGGVAYGFSDFGQLCEIDLATGQGTPIPIPNLTTTVSFWGAGVTTAAPIEVPK